MRFYKLWQELLFALRHRVGGGLPTPGNYPIEIHTEHPLAFESPDHLHPWGTSRDNSTNKKFVTCMARRIRSEMPAGAVLGVLDLGCSGGQLVKDFRDLGWVAVGLEGSDFSLKHGRANWPALAGKNLFTCDITKPFELTVQKQGFRFHLVTLWEVLEHIAAADLTQVFDNILGHLDRGGYLVATTTSAPDIHGGVDLHQTKWTNQEWKRWLAEKYPDLEPVDLALKPYHYVRHNEEGSILTYRRK